MKWKKLTIKTITEAEDMIISSLYDIGVIKWLRKQKNNIPKISLVLPR